MLLALWVLACEESHPELGEPCEAGPFWCEEGMLMLCEEQEVVVFEDCGELGLTCETSRIMGAACFRR
jgi:hypothetical protein